MLLKSRNVGKSKAWALQLQYNIEQGLDCAVATLNPEKTKAMFKNITGIELVLKMREDKNTYTASLHYA